MPLLFSFLFHGLRQPLGDLVLTDVQAGRQEGRHLVDVQLLQTLKIGLDRKSVV